MNLRILVINLKASSKRRDRISKQLDVLGIPYDFLEATEGPLLTDKWIESNIGDYLKRVYYNNEHFSVNKNALACADSHRRAQLIAANSKSDYTLVLEDDVELTSSFRNKILNTVKLMQEHSLHLAFAGYNLASGSCEKRLDINCSGFGFSFLTYPVVGHVSGSYAYIVDHIGARELVKDNTTKIKSTADTFHIKEKGLDENTVVLYPKLVTTGYFESDIVSEPMGFNFVKMSKRAIYSLSLKSNTIHGLLRYKKERTM